MKLFRWTVFLFLLSSISATAFGQTIADMARQERQRQKELSSITLNADTKGKPTAGATAVTAAGTTAGATTPKKPATSGPTDNKGRDEKFWRTAFENARQDAKRAQDRLRLIDLKLTELKSLLLREGIYTREQEIRGQIATAEKEQELGRKQVADTQQKLVDLEEELRKSGGLPGWAR